MDRNGEEEEVEENVKEEVGKGWDKKKEDGVREEGGGGGILFQNDI